MDVCGKRNNYGIIINCFQKGIQLMTKQKWNSLPITVKASLAYTICNIFQRCISFITLPLFTRLLSTEQYGQATVYSSWSGIIGLFITLNLAYGSFSTAMLKYEKDRDGYISSLQGVFTLLALGFFVIYLPLRYSLNQLFELPTKLVVLMIIDIVCQNTQMLWSGKQRFAYKYKSIVGLTVLSTVLGSIVAYLLVINSTEKGYARIFGYAIVNIVLGIIIYIIEAIKGKKLYNKEYWTYAFGFNIPLLVYYLSQYVFNQSDRIMISHMSGTDKAGIYGIAYNLAAVMGFVLSAINNSYVPWYYGKIKTKQMEDNRSVSSGIAFLMMLLFLSVIWFAPEFIIIMAGEKYTEAISVVPPIAVSMLLLFYTQLFVNVEFYFEEKKKLIWASVGAALINIVLNYIFIQVFGFVAAAYTTLISYVVFCYANYRAMKKVLAERGLEDVGYDYMKLIGIFLGLVILTIIGVMLYGVLWVRIAIAGTVFIVMIWKRNYLLHFYKEIKKK